MHITEFDYNLPTELIAKFPADKRDHSRLLVLNKDKKTLEHKHFYDILEYLSKGDCLVLNNSKVLPARIYGKKINTGANVEFLLLKRVKNDTWKTLVKPGKKLHIGDKVVFNDGLLTAEITLNVEDGTRIVKFTYVGEFLEILDEIGKMPLPPYIDRENTLEDRNRYQTVYCEEDGSVAAPTAGLHFTKDLLKKISEKGVNIAFVTLHVGIGTFRPVKCDEITNHKMHFEQFSITKENAEIINNAKLKGGKIISVGTTSCRVLESVANEDGKVVGTESNTDIFIYPGYKFKIIDGLITNFHLPKSTLLMLVSAFYDRNKILQAYETAIAEKYGFFSYGDAMLIK